MTKREACWNHGKKRRAYLIYLWTILICTCSCDQQFDPYVLNGGLVAAIAGKNYVVFSSDTRLTSGGYEILSRRHVSSRLWPVSSPSVSLQLSHSASVVQDGLPIIYEQEWNVSSSMNLPHTWIASAGCAADCEALKRYVQAEYYLQQDGIMALTHAVQSPKHLATFLSNVLYSRRAFPYYSFCVLAGLCITNDHDDDNSDLSGVVHIYDAIGSHERVAVACAGTGREILQPILDRLFAESSRKFQPRGTTPSSHNTHTVARFWTSKVPTCVECPVDEAVGLLLHGYRAASEREIQVGDSIVVGILQHGSDEINKDAADGIKNGRDLKTACLENKSIRLTFLRYPLKEH